MVRSRREQGTWTSGHYNVNMRTFFLAALLLSSSAMAQTLAEVEKWPVLYKYVEDEQSKQQTFTAQEAALLQQIIQNANSRPELRGYRASLPQWAQKNLTLNDVMLSQVAPFRSPQAERLTIFRFAENWPARLVVLSGAGQSSAWLLTDDWGCEPFAERERFFVYDLDKDRQVELGWAHGCVDSSGALQTFSLLDWQRGQLSLSYETLALETQSGVTEKADIHVRSGPQPQLVSVKTVTQYSWDERQQTWREDQSQTTLHTLQTPVKAPSFTVTRLW